MLLLNPRRTRTNMKLLQLVWIFLLTLCGQSGAVPKPYVTILGETKNGMLLQCEVFDVSPKLHVSWRNSAGDNVPAKEPQKTETGDIILQTTVTKTDYYRCVTTEGKKDDELHSEIFVRPYGASNGLVIGIAAAVAGVVVGRFFCHRKSAGGPTTDGDKKKGYNLAEQNSDD